MPAGKPKKKQGSKRKKQTARARRVTAEDGLHAWVQEGLSEQFNEVSDSDSDGSQGGEQSTPLEDIESSLEVLHKYESNDGSLNVSKSILMDLHTHSTYSDGKLTPAQLVARAAQQGVHVLALTDHDTMAGIGPALAAGVQLGVRVIPGVEISASTALRGSADGSGHPVHILGYYGAAGPSRGAELESALAHIREGRFTRARKMVEKLRKLGMAVEWERVLEIAGKGVAPGRPHLAQALLEARHVATAQEAFTKYLGDGGPAYATGAELPAEDAVELICRTGGVAVLAHPWSLKSPERLVGRLKAAGLHGMEAHRDPAKLAYYGGLAIEHALLRLGGSDFHGTGNPNEKELGSIPLPPVGVFEFLTRASDIWQVALKERITAFAVSRERTNDGALDRHGVGQDQHGSQSAGGESDPSRGIFWFGDAEGEVELRLSEWMTARERRFARREARRLGLVCGRVWTGVRKAVVLRLQDACMLSDIGTLSEQ